MRFATDTRAVKSYWSLWYFKLFAIVQNRGKIWHKTICRLRNETGTKFEPKHGEKPPATTGTKYWANRTQKVTAYVENQEQCS
jgi:hypothetical protein